MYMYVCVYIYIYMSSRSVKHETRPSYDLAGIFTTFSVFIRFHACGAPSLQASISLFVEAYISFTFLLVGASIF